MSKSSEWAVKNIIGMNNESLSPKESKSNVVKAERIEPFLHVGSN